MLTVTVWDGDSGAWVVHSAAPELYGHMVATDAIGDAYILPAFDTFSNIRDCMGAVAVQLPTLQDVENRAYQHSHYLEPTWRPHASHIDCRLPRLDLDATINNDTSEAIDTAAKPPGTIPEPVEPRSSVKTKPHNRRRKRILAKKWNSKFSTRFNINEHVPYNNHDEATNWEQDTLDLFLSGHQGQFPSFKAEEATELLRNMLSSAKCHDLGAMNESLGRAWLDDREYTRGFSREYRGQMTANQLRSALSYKVC
jgi:hypothetical protein